MSETKAPTPEQIAEWRRYAENEHRWLHRVLDWLEASQKRAEEAERLLRDVIEPFEMLQFAPDYVDDSPMIRMRISRVAANRIVAAVRRLESETKS